jgi:two-component system response regulator DesR
MHSYGHVERRTHGAVSTLRPVVTRVLLVDDQPQILEGLAMLLALEPDLEVVGATDSGARALELARRERPDVVVMDVRLSGVDGIAVTRQLRRELPACRVVILSLYGDPETRRRAEQAGAAAFVAKHDMHEALLATIRRVAAPRPHNS